MLKGFSFYKYHGCGNDFILFPTAPRSSKLSSFAKQLCHRQEGIGADGILLLEERQGCDAYLRIFNSDGSEASFCGNGLRCAAHYLANTSQNNILYRVEMESGSYLAKVEGNEVEVALGNLPSPLEGPLFSDLLPEIPLYRITVGVPHLVALVPSLGILDVNSLGRILAHSSLGSATGANVDFVCRHDHLFEVRTYERGVESETLACGSGAAAAAIATAYHWQELPPLALLTRHGSTLYYTFSLQGRQALSLTMRGPTLCSFQGTIHLSL